MSSPTKLDAIVTQNSILRQLVRQAAAHKDLDRFVKSLIDQPLSSHLSLESIRDGVVTLVADSSAWAAKLRYQVPELHRLFGEKSALSNIHTIRVKVANPSASAPVRSPSKIRPLSPRTVAALEQSARQAGDPKLREALMRLKRRGR